MPDGSNAEPYRLSAVEVARRIDAGGLTAEAVVASCLGRIKEREPVVRAWAHLDPAQALAAAHACDRGGKAGLLKGVPFAVKDIFDTADMPAGYGSPIYTGCRPSFDASAVALPRAAGAILMGKTVTTEFANRHPGPTANPHNPGYSPGGSSSGSAAAVADCMVPLAIGTQTGGSVIRPAAYCGVVGFKPSFGLFPPAGMHMNTDSLDTVGAMARSVADIALFRAALMAIPYEAPAMPRPPRLALCRTMHWERAQPEGKRCARRGGGTAACGRRRDRRQRIAGRVRRHLRDPAAAQRLRGAAQPRPRTLPPCRPAQRRPPGERPHRRRPCAQPRRFPHRLAPRRAGARGGQ